MGEHIRASDPVQNDGENATLKERFIHGFIRVVVYFLYESVVVYSPPAGGIDDRPTLAVSNHFGGLADPLVLMYAAPRRPRIMARDKIWRIPLAGAVMDWIGAIPVHKPHEQRSPTSNKEMFRSAYDALHRGDVVLIFPEGITRDDPSIAPLKTGAARIALGARAEGTQGLRILPVGIHYEDKAALRSRIFVNAGVPIDLDANVTRYAADGLETPENRDAVTRLTTDIEVHLRNVAPNFANWEEAHAFTEAAEITLRSEGPEPPSVVSISDRDRLAAVVGQSDAGCRREVMSTLIDYRRDLDGLGLSDEQTYHRLGTARFSWFLIKNLLVLLVLIPLALLGLVANVWPLGAVGAVNLLSVAPAVKATLKPAAGILVGLMAWGVVLWMAFTTSIWLGVLAALALPASLAALIYASERVVRISQVGRQWLKAGRLARVTDQIGARRAAVHGAVRSIDPTTGGRERTGFEPNATQRGHDDQR